MHDHSLRRVAHDLELVIAIDGPAGAGKSTVGAGLAEALDCAYLDTGLMYRAVTWLAFRTGVSVADGEALGKIARDTAFSLSPEHGTISVDGVALGNELRQPDVDANVSLVSAHAQVRNALVDKQREIARARCAVVVGRDIGTAVLPDAPLKLWITASPDRRALRRLADRGPRATLSEVTAEVRQRDRLDMTRDISPLYRAADAITIETDDLTPAEAVARGLEAVRAAADPTNPLGR